MIASAIPVLSIPNHLQNVEEFEEWQRRYAYEGSYEFVRGRIIEKKETK